MYIALTILAALLVLALNTAILWAAVRYIGKHRARLRDMAVLAFIFSLASILGGVAIVLVPVGVILLHRRVKLNWRRSAVVLLAYFIPAAFITAFTFLLLHAYVFTVFRIQSNSMSPAVNNGDSVIVSKTEVALLHEVPKRGEIVVFRYPKDRLKIFAQRVVGLPGDRVVIAGGTVTVFNAEHPKGFNPDTSYLPVGTKTSIDTYTTVPDGQLFIMGDNRAAGASYDSREWGLLPVGNLIGIVQR